MSKIKQLWTEKYRPDNLDSYIFQNANHKKIINGFIENKDIPHLLLTGQAGSGKTTISMMIPKLLGIDPGDILRINGSDENGVDTIRNKIIGFASTFPIGKLQLKIVQIEEFDYCGVAAQAILREVMETYSSNCRFICTANYEHKIIPALKSRFQHLKFLSPVKEDVIVRIAEILLSENIDFVEEDLDMLVDSAYPDIRKIINNASQSIVDGKLLKESAASVSDYKFSLLDKLKNEEFSSVRKYLIESVPVEEYDELYKFLYQHIHLLTNELSEEAQMLIVLNEAQYKHKIVGVPELNLDVCLIKIQQLLKS